MPMIHLIFHLALFSFISLIFGDKYLSASPEFINSTSAEITVSWTNITSPNISDWIGIYVTNRLSDNDYLGWKWANESKTWKAGHGSVVFDLLNMRHDYLFKYFRNSEMVAASNEVKTLNRDLPMQIHIALSDSPTQMRVMWVSGNDKRPIVEYGTTRNLGLTVKGTSSTYSVDDMINCESSSQATINFLDPGFIHNVLLNNLKSKTTYYYRVGDGTTWSDIFQFTSAPPVGPSSGVSLVAFGDMGTSYCESMSGWCETGSQGTTDSIEKLINQGQNFDLLLHIGDISYAVGMAHRWEQFFWQIQPIASEMPYMVSIGNHEYDHGSQPFKPDWSNYGEDSYGECGVPFSNRFYMPNSNGVWYSFEYGNIHFTLFSAEHDFTQSSEQYKWLKNDLLSVDRKRTPFLIVGTHRPMYSSGAYLYDYIMSLHLQQELEDLFVAAKVDLGLYGHYHSYERTCKVYKQQCNSTEGVIHLVIGNAGQVLDNEWFPQPHWSVVRDGSHFGFSTISTNSTHLHFKSIDDTTFEVIDELWIIKQ